MKQIFIKKIIITLILFFSPIIIVSQTQIGDDIDGEAGAYFGQSVSLSSNGNTMAIGSPYYSLNNNYSGLVKIYRKNNGNWVQIGDDIEGDINDKIGYYSSSISLSSDGNIVAIGSPYNSENGDSSGKVRIYQNINENWVQIGTGINGEAASDLSAIISLSSDGSIVAIGSSYNDGNGDSSGHIRIFKNNNGSWEQVGNDIDGESAGDEFGSSISLSSDGSIVAAGGILARGNNRQENGTYANISQAGHVRILKNNNGSWEQVGNDIEGKTLGEQLGNSVSLSSDGNIVAIRASRYGENEINSGYVGIYKNINDTWVKVGNSILGEGKEGFSRFNVSLSSNGNVVAIGTSESDNGNDIGSGRVKLYENINHNFK